MTNHARRVLSILALLAVSPLVLALEASVDQTFDAALAAFHATLVSGTPAEVRKAAQGAGRQGEALLAHFDQALDEYAQSEGSAAEENWIAAASGAADAAERMAQLHMDELPYALSYRQVQMLAEKSYAAAAQYREQILARQHSLQYQEVDEVALRRKLFLDYFLVKDSAHYTAQMTALARIHQQSPEVARTPLFTPITMQEEGDEITGAIEIEFDIGADGRVHHPRIIGSTYTGYGGDEFEYLLLFWFKEFRFTPGVDGDNLVPVEAAHYRLEGTRRLTRVRRRVQ